MNPFIMQLSGLLFSPDYDDNNDEKEDDDDDDDDGYGFLYFCTVHFNIIIQYKPKNALFHKLKY